MGLTASKNESAQSLEKEAEDEEKTAGHIQAAVEDRLNGQTFTVVLVGPAGAGKSTLVNTLIMRPECKEGTGASFVTAEVEARTVSLPLKQGKGAAVLQVYDSPGFTGDKEEDPKTTKGLQGITEIDLVLICFDITSDGGRYTPMREGFILQKVVEALGKEVVREKGLIVLTKANRLDTSREGQTDGGKLSLFEGFRNEHERQSKKLAKELQFLGELGIVMAGRLEFDAEGKPSQITDVNGGKEWLNDLFNASGGKASDGLCGLFYAALTQAQNDPKIDPEVKKNLATPNRRILHKVILYGLAATAGTALLVGTAGLAAGALAPTVAPAAAAALAASSAGEAAAALAGASVAAQAGGAAASAATGILTSLLSYWKGTKTSAKSLERSTRTSS